MPRRKPAPAANDFLRRSIASAAARLMAEGGIGDYGAAKRKAARNLGSGDGDVLPSNEEIEAELRIYQSLYQEDEQRERLREMRETALEVMEFVADFRPCLTGAVLDGTAGRFSEVELDLFADSAKDVEISLLSRDISYEISDKGQPTHHAAHLPEAQLRLEWGDIPVLLSVYPLAGERQHKRSGHGSRSHARARPTAVAALLAEAGNP
ncbi:MAG: nucleotidyltransferase [Sulfurisoma sp.]|nr:nucleotidyltransferase [Sulfurisoma sp.]